MGNFQGIEGLSFQWNPETLTKAVRELAVRILHEEGKQAKHDIIASFSRGVSQPGQPPGIQTGKLVRGLKFRVIRGQLKLILGVDTSVVYARALEMGSDSTNLRARPYLRPQRLRSEKRIQRKLVKALK